VILLLSFPNEELSIGVKNYTSYKETQASKLLGKLQKQHLAGNLQKIKYRQNTEKNVPQQDRTPGGTESLSLRNPQLL